MRIENSVDIEMPPEKVFAFATDPASTALWAGPVAESKQTSEGPLGVGTTSTRVTQILGRSMESDYEVTEYEPNSKYSAKTTSGPLPIIETLLFDATESGTNVTLIGDLEGGTGFFKLAEPILGRIAQRQTTSDLGALKDLLEAQS
jgi:uncharacterized protein YndB with AHSA1/START domain